MISKVCSALALTLLASGGQTAAQGTQVVPAHKSAGATTATITFRDSAAVRGGVIHLADVAAVGGAGLRLAREIEQIEIGPAPLPGRSRQVYANYAYVGLRRLGIDPANVKFEGAAATTVNRPEQIAHGAALVKAAAAMVESHADGQIATIALQPLDVHAPAGRLEIRAQEPRMLGAASGVVPVDTLVDGHIEATTLVSFRLAKRISAVVAARDIPYGTVITEADVRIEERPETQTGAAVTDLGQAIGQQATATIHAGAPINTMELCAAIVIKRGSLIRLVCRGPNFVATTMGEALQDGAAGKLIRVRNLNSNLEMAGQVESADTVSIPY